MADVASEEAFLAAYDADAFPRPSLAVDVVLLWVDAGSLWVRLVRRSAHPFAGTWTLPGTFVGIDEDLPDAAQRVLGDKLGLGSVHLEPFHTFGAPDRDPRMRIVTVAHLALVATSSVSEMSCRWGRVVVPWQGVDGGEVRVQGEGAELPIGFDHAHIVGGAVAHLRRRLGEGGRAGVLEVVRPLLPDAFTLRRVQSLHEAVAGRRVNKDSFRRKILAEGRIEATGEREASVGHRPAELYRYRGH